MGRENSKCKGPGAGTFLMCLTSSQEASVTGIKRAKGKVGEDEVVEVIRDRIVGPLWPQQELIYSK